MFLGTEKYKYLKSIRKMNAQELRNLQEAYMEVVMNEGKKPYPLQRVKNQIEKIGQKGGDNWKLRQSYENELLRQAKEERIKNAEKRSPTFYQQKNKLKMTKTQREQVDLYDIILSHLLDEGYAETPEAAEVIMVNMSEDWRESIVEEKRPYPAEKVARKREKVKKDEDIAIYQRKNAEADKLYKRGVALAMKQKMSKIGMR